MNNGIYPFASWCFCVLINLYYLLIKRLDIIHEFLLKEDDIYKNDYDDGDSNKCHDCTTGH